MLEYLRKEVYKLKSELPASNYLNDQEPFLGQIFGADGILASLIPNFEKKASTNRNGAPSFSLH